MIQTVYIISYFGAEEKLIQNRLKLFTAEIKWLLEAAPLVKIVVFWQNREDLKIKHPSISYEDSTADHILNASAARNVLLRIAYASGEEAFFLMDDDIQLVEGSANPFEYVRLLDELNIEFDCLSFVSNRMDAVQNNRSILKHNPKMWSGFLCIKTTVARVMYFDENLSAHQDVDFGLSLWYAGARLYIVSNPAHDGGVRHSVMYADKQRKERQQAAKEYMVKKWNELAQEELVTISGSLLLSGKFEKKYAKYPPEFIIDLHTKQLIEKSKKERSNKEDMDTKFPMSLDQLEEQLQELKEEVKYLGTIDALFAAPKWEELKPVFERLLKPTTTDELKKAFKKVGLRTSGRIDRFMNGEAIQFGWLLCRVPREVPPGESPEFVYQLVPIGWDGENIPKGMVTYDQYSAQRSAFNKLQLKAPSIAEYYTEPDKWENYVAELPKKPDGTPRVRSTRGRKLGKAISVADPSKVCFVIPSVFVEGNYNITRTLQTWNDFVVPEMKNFPTLVIYAQGYDEVGQSNLAAIIGSMQGHVIVHHGPKFPLPLSMPLIRESSFRVSQMYGTWDYLVMGDDDFEFKNGSGNYYDFGVEYMKHFPAIGMVQASGYLGGYYDRDALLTRWGAFVWTDRGLILRVTPDNTFFLPTDVQKLGGLEESLLAVSYQLRGYAIATLKNVPTVHHSYRHNSKAKKAYLASMTPEKLETHMCAENVVGPTVQHLNRVCGEGTYTIKQYAPEFQSTFKSPSLDFFRIHLGLSIQQHGYCQYTHDDGQYSRGLPKGWRNVPEMQLEQKYPPLFV